MEKSMNRNAISKLAFSILNNFKKKLQVSCMYETVAIFFLMPSQKGLIFTTLSGISRDQHKRMTFSKWGCIVQNLKYSLNRFYNKKCIYYEYFSFSSELLLEINSYYLNLKVYQYEKNLLTCRKRGKKLQKLTKRQIHGADST